MNARSVVEQARTFTEHGISAGLTAQVSSVVRFGGVEKVALLSVEMFNNPAAGALMHSYLAESMEKGRDSAAIARELALVSDVQRFTTLSAERGELG